MTGPTPQTDQASRESTLTSYQSAVVRVIQAMKGRLDEPFSLKAMAKVAYSSPYHFNRTFRRITGIPPCQYLWALRLEAATRRLTATEDSVLNVCYDVGYNSLGTFTRRFTELFGVPPARFRALARATHDHHERLGEALQRSTLGTAETAEGPLQAQVDGWIDYPADFSGPCAIGLFADSIPQGRPVACCFATSPGAFRMTDVPDGRYCVFALGIRTGMSLCDTQTMLRAGGDIILVKSGKVFGTAILKLRPPESTDPPILLTLPVLLQKLAANAHSERVEDAEPCEQSEELYSQAHGD
jgi:AraC family transcriptional regulator